MKVPVQVTVGGKKVRIQYVETLPDDCSGELEVGAATVRISKSRHANEREVFTTLFHELIHFALERTGHSAVWTDAQEEPLVYALENMLAELFWFRSDGAVKYREVEWVA
jgi:hypothetical protein